MPQAPSHYYFSTFSVPTVGIHNLPIQQHSHLKLYSNFLYRGSTRESLKQNTINSKHHRPIRARWFFSRSMWIKFSCVGGRNVSFGVTTNFSTSNLGWNLALWGLATAKGKPLSRVIEGRRNFRRVASFHPFTLANWLFSSRNLIKSEVMFGTGKAARARTNWICRFTVTQKIYAGVL